jgi:glycosyltransferase involved in cell wall biosynthesis
LGQIPNNLETSGIKKVVERIQSEPLKTVLETSMVEKKIKIGFFIPSLTSGGAERIMAYLSQEIDRNRFDTTLIVIGSEKEARYEVIGTRTLFLNKDRVLLSIPRLFRVLSKEKFDVTMSAIRHMNALMGFLSIFFPKTKFIGREVNVMSVLDKYKEPNDREYPHFVYRYSYKHLDAIVCQSRDMLNDLSIEFPKYKSKYRLINNPITTGFQPKKNKTTSSPPYKFITVASLEPRKGHDRILRGLATLNLDFEYTIIGKGSLEEKIKQNANELGLDDKIRHIPFTSEVKKHLEESHIFIQGSYVEGFPNALLESCAVGTPIIAFNAPGGIDEIVEKGVNGYIVENENELKESIELILGSDEFIPEKVSRSVFEKYHSSIIVSKYERLFEEVDSLNQNMN